MGYRGAKTKLKQKLVQRILSKWNHFWIASPTPCVTFFVNLFLLSWVKYFANGPFNHFYKLNKHCKFSILANVWNSQENYEKKSFFSWPKLKDSNLDKSLWRPIKESHKVSGKSKLNITNSNHIKFVLFNK